MKGKMSLKSATIFLALNDMGKLSTLAIESVLKFSSAQIFIGYVNRRDIDNLPKHERIHYIALASDASELSGSKYLDYSTDAFFEIVQLKWNLISQVLEEFDFVVYSDLDVMWRIDINRSLSSLFSQQSRIQIAIQDNSPSLDNLILCMGLFAIRKSAWSKDFLADCLALHQEEASRRSRVGDDEIVTTLYHRENNSSHIFLLPQAVFPTGNLIALSRRHRLFPNPQPHPFALFHANYAVGLRKKILFQYVSLASKSERKLFFTRYEIMLLQFELQIRRIKSLVASILRIFS